MRAYLRVDPNLADRKHDYPDGAFRAFVECLTFAEQQPHRGRFRNEKLLRVLLERRARWVPYLIEKGDLVREGSVLYFDGWDEWQEGDWKVAERVERIRNKKRRAVTPTVTDTVTDTVTSTVSTPLGGRREAVGGKPLPAQAVGGAPLQNGVALPASMMSFAPRKPKALSKDEIASYRKSAVSSSDPLVKANARQTLEKAGIPVEVKP